MRLRIAPAASVNPNMINSCHAAFISGHVVVKNWFMRRRTRSLAPLIWTPTIFFNPLKSRMFLSLTNCPLN